jgi:Putative F0F1-ATPase subunit Ca2+/Mg2+ transporter
MADDKDNLKKTWIGAEKYVQLGIAIPAATFIGWLLGGLVQRWLHYEWLPLAGLIVGTIAGLGNFIRVSLAEDTKS